ncbi:MAG: hypothetical protein ACTHNU_13225 [Gaiellales bacterium]
MANLILPGGERVDIPRRLWFPSAMTIVSLFLGGLYLGKVVSETPNAVGAYVTTQTIHGKVVKVHGKPIRVLVPASTVISQGKIVTVISAHTVDLTQPQPASTVVRTIHGTKYVTETQTVPVTTTYTTATTVASTIVETATVTDTVTVTDTGTTTVTTTAVSN